MARLSYPLAVFLLAVALLAIHATCLDNSFHYDDGHSVVRNPHIRSLANLGTFFTDPHTFSADPEYGMYRPVVLTSLAINYALGGYAPKGYILLNLVLHIAVSILLLYTIGQLGFPLWAAFGAALLFGLHPLQTEVVNYVSSRSESLAALFFLSAFLSYLMQVNSRGWHWLAFSLVAFALALGSKATAITLPAILLLHSWLLTPPDKRLSPLAHLPYWVLAAGYTTYSLWGINRLVSPEQVRSFDVQFYTQLKAIIYYFIKSFMPVHLNIYPQFFTSSNLFELSPFISALVLGSVLAIAALHSGRGPLAFGLSWFAITLSPTLVVPLHILVNDHRLYLPLMGLALALAGPLKAGTNRLFLPMAALALLFGLLSFNRDQAWRSELTLWQAAANQAPLMPETHYNLGYAHHQQGSLDKARQAYQKAVALSPTYARAQTNLGVILRQEGQLEQALKAFNLARNGDPWAIEPINNIGLIYMELGQLEQAAKTYEQGLEIRPELAELWFNLGLVYRNWGQREKALEYLTKAVQLDPGLKERFPAGGAHSNTRVLK